MSERANERASAKIHIHAYIARPAHRCHGTHTGHSDRKAKQRSSGRHCLRHSPPHVSLTLWLPFSTCVLVRVADGAARFALCTAAGRGTCVAAQKTTLLVWARTADRGVSSLSASVSLSSSSPPPSSSSSSSSSSSPSPPPSCAASRRSLPRCHPTHSAPISAGVAMSLGLDMHVARHMHRIAAEVDLRSPLASTV